MEKSSIKSQIFKNEKIINANRKFGAVKSYYPVYIQDHLGESKYALFTISELNNAIDRAANNREDFRSKFEEPKPSIISRILNFKIF
jgi:hypothetical protein